MYEKNHSFTALCPKYALNLKLPLVMRISLALLFAVVLQLSAEDGYAQRTRVAISMNNVSVEQVLNKIERRPTMFSFIMIKQFRRIVLFL